MKARKEVEMSHKAQIDELTLTMEKIAGERDEVKRGFEYLKSEHENIKIEIDKEKTVSKAKFREELDIVLKENESLHT
jgi:hypothetical protein